MFLEPITSINGTIFLLTILVYDHVVVTSVSLFLSLYLSICVCVWWVKVAFLISNEQNTLFSLKSSALHRVIYFGSDLCDR